MEYSTLKNKEKERDCKRGRKNTLTPRGLFVSFQESRDERGRRETTSMKDISPIHSAALPKSSPVTPYVRKGDLAVSQEKHKCPST